MDTLTILTRLRLKMQNGDDLSIEIINKKWKHRRRMSYFALGFVCFLTLLVILLAAFGMAGDLKDFNSLLVTVFFGLMSIVGAYFGLSTIADNR